MTACSKGYPQVVEVLLDGGARPDLQSKVRRQYIPFQCIWVSVIITSKYCLPGPAIQVGNLLAHLHFYGQYV